MSNAPRTLHVAQLNLPSEGDFREAFEAIFARDFYTNHGPLEHELDQALATYFGVRHVVSVVNATTALMLTLKALDLKGHVITPAFTFPATAQAAVWAGLNPVFCDVDPDTHVLTSSRVADLIGPETTAILGVHVWGRGCNPGDLEALAGERGLKLVFDASHAVGCTFGGKRIGGFGDAEIFSFHATKILNGLEGGCIATNDEALAARLRTMRSFRDGGEPAGLLRINAKVSEAQAAMALLGLRDIDTLIGANRRRYEAYRRGLAGIRGVHFVDHAAGERSNYQFVVTSISPRKLGMTRDALVENLQAKGIMARRYFHPGVHEIPPFSGKQWVLPVTDRLCQSLIQLPTGQTVTDRDVENVCAAVRAAAEM